MRVHFRCRECSSSQSRDAGQAGQTIQCPQCRANLVVPQILSLWNDPPATSLEAPHAMAPAKPENKSPRPAARTTPRSPEMAEEEAFRVLNDIADVPAHSAPRVPEPASMPKPAIKMPAPAKPTAAAPRARRRSRKIRRPAWVLAAAIVLPFFFLGALGVWGMVRYQPGSWFATISPPPAPSRDGNPEGATPASEDPWIELIALRQAVNEVTPARVDEPESELPPAPPAKGPPIDEAPIGDAIENPPRPEERKDGPPPRVKPADVAPLLVKRRNQLSEDELRKKLEFAPEVTRLDTPTMVKMLEAYTVALETSGNTNLEPSVVLKHRPEVKGLPVRAGMACRIHPESAATLEVLSKKLHDLVDQAVPKGADGTRPDAVLLTQILRVDKRGKKPEWLRAEAIPTLMQILMHEDAPVRLMLVNLLDEIPGKAASVALAQRAVFDLSPDVRQAAIVALQARPKEEYRTVLLNTLRYPIAPPADYAAEALIALDDKDSIPYLVTLLDKPDPSAPFATKDGHVYERDIVRIHHLSNCMLCHPPALSPTDRVLGPVPGVNFQSLEVRKSVKPVSSSTRVPTVSRQSPRASTGGGGGYSGSSGGGSSPGSGASVGSRTVTVNGKEITIDSSIREQPLTIRADITYIRQDFSVQQPVYHPETGKAIDRQRFDYVVRLRRLTPKEAAQYQTQTKDKSLYPQKEAVLYALRELTGKDAGHRFQDWVQLYPTAQTEVEAPRLTDQLVKLRSATQQEELIAKYRDEKGPMYTRALAAAIPRLKNGMEERARDALAERLARMSLETLREKMQDDDVEIRRAAARACALRQDKEPIPELIALLDDGEPAVKQMAHDSLKKLTGRFLEADAQTWLAWYEEKK